MKTIFITSTGRTGTDFFTTLFNDYVGNAWSLHEPRPAFRRRSHQLISRKPTLFDRYYFKMPRVRWHRRHEEEWYVETNYHLAAAIDFLREVFPQTTVIHVIRDGRDVVTSWLNKYRYITNDHLLPEHVGDQEAMKKWDSWNPLQKLAWYWQTINQLAEKTQPDMWLRFEDIFAGDKKAVFEVLDRFEDLEYDSAQVKELLNKKVNKTRTPFFPPYEQWPSMWKQQFHEIAGDAMKRLGYTE